ncbi:MAG TPA: DUF1116 domain-containing protein [Burkholderiales bacterium]|nr:DUF1116 domain-containing protein [Burkholderiales bacterium]
MSRPSSPIASLLARPPRVVNVGLRAFAAELAGRDVAVAHVEWRPPAAGREHAAALLGALARHEARIAQANAEGLRRMLSAEPALVDVLPAGEAMPGLDRHVVLHAGPPIDWPRMCGPMRGAVAGALVFEGWAPDLAAATRLAASGAIDFRPNHALGAVGPMTGITTRSMPVMVVENRAFGNRSYCMINEGLGKVMRFGANDAEVLARIAWLRDEFGPRLGAALRAAGGLDLAPLVARGLAMGDEMHQRNVACSALVLRGLAPHLARAAGGAEPLAQSLAFIAGNEQFFLNVGMAMAKSVMDPVRGIEGCSLVTAMCRNGTDFGIRLSATGDAWFTAPVEMPQGLYFAGYGERDANPDMGDSAIMETVGLGAFAMAASPAVMGFVGAGRASDALAFTRAMGELTVGANPRWTIPALDARGVPAGIDARKVVDTGIQPAINTGIAHRRPGVGQVGAGVARAPLACFDQALAALVRALGSRP